MKKILTFITLSLFFNFSGISQSLQINSDQAIVDFNFVEEDAIGTVKGIKATINFDPTNLSIASIKGTADVTTLSTNNKMRDSHLQQADMFNAEKFPTMDFTSTSISKTDKGFKMIGKMTIKGTEKEVVVNFTYSKKTFVGRTIIFSNDFDVFSRKKREDSKVLVKITIPVL